jgi:hypothetical protein
MSNDLVHCKCRETVQTPRHILTACLRYTTVKTQRSLSLSAVFSSRPRGTAPSAVITETQACVGPCHADLRGLWVGEGKVSCLLHANSPHSIYSNQPARIFDTMYMHIMRIPNEIKCSQHQGSVGNVCSKDCTCGVCETPEMLQRYFRTRRVYQDH